MLSPEAMERKISAEPRSQLASAGQLVDTAQGVRSITTSLNTAPRFAPPAGAAIDRISPLLQVANAINASVPDSSAAKIRTAVALWQATLKWFEVPRDAITAAVPVALLVARCCPPVGLELPSFLQRRVLPVTAAADIDAMRRAALIGVHGMEGSLAALSDHKVLALQRAIGGRARRITTSKRPLLYHEIEAMWNEQRRLSHPHHAQHQMSRRSPKYVMPLQSCYHLQRRLECPNS